MTMTKEERVLRVINGQEVDYLPSQITFSDRTRDKAISEALGLDGPEVLDDYLENHIYIALSAHDKTLFYRNDRDEMARLNPLYAGMSHARLEREWLRWPCRTPDDPGTEFLHEHGTFRFHAVEHREPVEQPDELSRVRGLHHQGVLPGDRVVLA